MSTSISVPKQHKAAQFLEANGPVTIVTKDTPEPQENEVLIKVSASSICASDHFTQINAMGSPYPLSAGHEVVGRVAKLGKGVDESTWPIGHRVGLAWNAGYCSRCYPCRQGDIKHCVNHKVTGVTKDGGHQEYVTAHITGVVNLPQELNMKDSELAPLLCAGNTVFEALIGAGMQAGDVVVVQALGGLGHIAIQVAKKAGCTVICISGSPSKEGLAKELGADYYFTASDDKLQEKVEKIGLAKVALATAPSAAAASQLVPLLDRYGTLALVGVPNDGKPVEVGSLALILKNAKVQGLNCSISGSNERFTKWCNDFDIKAMIKEWPLDKAAEALKDSFEGKPQFRNVIVMP